MPTHEAIVDSLLPKPVEKPIPVRTAVTKPTRPEGNFYQKPTTETPLAAESAPTAESVKVAPQLTALARKEQAFRQREQALKERERQLESRLAEAERYSQLRTKIEAKDYSAAEELGLTYEEYTNYLLNKQSGEDPESQKFKALEEEIQSLKKRQEEQAEQEYEDTVAEYRKELKAAAQSPEFQRVSKFKEMGEQGEEFTGVDIALNLILDSWEQDSEEVTVEQALKLTDEFLKEKAKQWAALAEEEKAEEERQTLPPPRVTSRTLTQAMAPTGIEKKPARSLQHMSDSERYEEARRRVLARKQQY